MEVEAWIKEKKELSPAILNFLESEKDSENEFQALMKIIDDQKIVQNEQSIKDIFQLLYKIGENHHRNSDFFDRLVRIYQYITKEGLPINDNEIIDIYAKNKRLLLLLFEHKIIIPNESNVKYLIEKYDSNDQQLKCYLFSEIKNFLDEETRKNIENKIKEEFKEDIESFERKCKEGENSSQLCKLIRNDSITDFISFISETNLSLTSTIKADFYESNPFLIANKPSLIEYAFFYGSIQVIKNLIYKHAQIPTDICQYAIHSNKAEMIELVEENKIAFEIKDSIESIKCHHNAIADYITSKLTDDEPQKEKFYNDIDRAVIDSCNYYYYPEDIIGMILNPENERFKMKDLVSSFTKITIPSSITSIGVFAFFKCTTLTEIIIPSSITSIGNYAFSRCSKLTKITIPSSVTSIGSYTFFGCSSLTEISIPSSVIEIGSYVFNRCSKLTQITIHSSITSIQFGSFSDCSKLTEITIPSSVTSIGYNAFSGCSALTEISIPSSVTSIGYYAFYGCSALTQMSIPSSVTSFGKDAFLGCSSLAQITIPSSLDVSSLGIDSKVIINRI